MLVWPKLEWLQILVTALVPMVLGFAWFMVLQKPWMKAHGYTEADKPRLQKGAPKAYAGSLVGAIATSYALFVVLRFAGATEWVDGVIVAILVWVGFVATVLLSESLYEERKWALFLLSGGYNLLSLLVMGVVLTIWT